MNQVIEVLSNLPGLAVAWTLATHPPIGWVIALVGSAIMIATATWRLRLRRIP